MAAGPLHVSLVILHVLLVSVWFGLTLRLQFLAKALAGGPLSASEEIRTAGNRAVQVMTVAIILFYAAALANFFVGGGFSAYGPVYHTSLLLGLGLVLVQVLMIQPAWGRLSGGQPAQAKKVAMGIGIGHALWALLLILMFSARSGAPSGPLAGAPRRLDGGTLSQPCAARRRRSMSARPSPSSGTRCASMRAAPSASARRNRSNAARA